MNIYKSVDKAEGLQQGERQHSDKCVSKTYDEAEYKCN